MIGEWQARRARALRRKGDRARDAHHWADAARFYERWLDLRPDDGAIWIQLGHMRSELGDYPAADEAYARADAIRPHDPDLLICRGHLEKRRGRPERALNWYRASLAVDGNATAACEIATLDPPAPEPEPVAADAPEPEDDRPSEPPPGACEHFDHEVVHGWLSPQAPDDHVRFLAGDRLVGLAWPVRHHRRGDGVEFRAHLSLADAAEIRAERASDGRALAGSPFHAAPPARPDAPGLPAHAVRHVMVKPLAWTTGELALLVTHSATGAIKPHVLPYVRALAERGVATLLLVQADRPVDVGAALLDAAAGVMIRDNRGYDFAAWAHALALHPDAWGAATLFLLNDSVIPATGGDRLGRLLDRVRASAADLVGLTDSHEYRWHLQSYFLALKPGALSSFTLQHFFGAVDVVDNKDAIIRRFELPLARLAEDAGCRVEVLFPATVALNPVLNEWRELLSRGFPFAKLLLLRGAFSHVDLIGWREALAAAEFDTGLVDAVLRASEEDVPQDADDRLYAHPVPAAPVQAAARLKVALYGPWNYDNGLGHAARGLVGALRHAGVQLNLHPVEQPFHIHRPLALPTPVRDFTGPADVAVVHLNPDSWHLLTSQQRDEIGAARRRIGYWVWEMNHIPDAWWQNFGSVDRIWAPSRYCADLFERADGPPVDIVPHAVPLPAGRTPDPAERAALLAELGVDPRERVILYVFDGSSYLVRKNPAAAIRAFAASGLARQGWTLLLKTKHLMDRADAGRALRALADGEDKVVLVDRALDPATLERLVAACDIYTSPHCSEGFGLTVAEAMAAARPVVATDFGGTADMLDATTGYPVRWHPWRLAEDHGHYTRDGEWARVDEPALAHAFTRAAAAADLGDTRIGDAARRRIAGSLSFRAVGDAIARSLADLDTPRPYREPVRLRALNLHAGVPVERGTGDARVRAVALAPDGSPGAMPPAGDDAEWLVFAPAGSLLSPRLADLLLAQAAARPDVAIFYGDDVAGHADEPVDQFRLKPAFDRTLLAAQDYAGAPLMVRADALAALGGLDPGMKSAALADLMFRADAAGRSIARLPEILLAHPGERVRATPADYRAMLEAQPSLSAFAIRPGRTPDSFALDRRYPPGGEPPVSIIIPTCRSPIEGGDGSWIAQLLDGLAGTDWPMERLTVIVGDDGADEPAWATAPRPYALRRIVTTRAPDAAFNYAAKMNRLWREATTEQILFMNDDILLGDPGWLRALQTFAVARDVGGVGARLLYTDGTLQHAGLVPHGAGAAHAWLYRRRERGTFHDWALTHREWSMVTGAVFATRRSLMEEVNGFDEAFTVEFNDTDLCLRLRALGYRIICTPFAELTHAEKKSRGAAPPAGQTIARFRARWAGWLADDPSFHPRLRRDRFDLRPDVGDRQWFF